MLQRVALLVAVSVTGTANADEFADGFSDPALTGWTRADEVEWTVEGGVLTSPPAGGVTGMLLAPVRESAASIRVDVMLPAEGRRNASVAFGMQPDGTGYAVRWYDQRRWLELLRFDSGAVVRVGGNHWQAASPEGSAPQTPGEWHVMAVDVVGTRVRAKVWPKDGDEPDWQLVADCPEAASGACGIGVDETVARFDNFVALTGEHVADLLREEREAQLALRRRARSIGLQEEAPHEALLTAQFTATGQTPAADLIFMAADESTHYFARADADGVHIGKVMRGHETILATQTRRWHDGPGDYRLEVLVTESSRDDRGQAWFINRAQVPPMVRVRARVGGGRGWAVSVHDDPIIPGKVGERYWDLDPIANSSAQRPFGARVGWRRAAGVRWTNLEVADRTASHAPKTTVTPVQRIDTGDRGGCWVALGDLDGDERLDYLVARNTDQRITALTAYANAGHELWRWGEGGGEDIAYDIPCIIYDIDHDGAAEVLISIAGYVLVLSGDTGEEERRHALPEGLSVADCIIIANLRGLAEPADIIIKTRYDKAWAYTDGWEPLWEFEGNTGHHPDVEDIDGDGRDEVLCGFTLIDDDGTILWSKGLPGHADAARLTRMEADGPWVALNSCCGGNDLALTALDGEFIWRQQPEIMNFHWQTVHVGEIRPDVPGFEAIIDEGWAKPARGRMVLVSARGEWLGAFYVSYPRFHRIIDWDGDGVMELVIPSDGVIHSGKGRPLVELSDAPSLGGPGTETPMVHVADVLGDGRDELIVFNAREIAIFTNPTKPKRAIPPQPAVMKRYYNATYY